MVLLSVVSVTYGQSSGQNDPGSPEADDPPSDVSPEGQQWPNVMSQCLRHSPHFTHHIGILSSLITR